MALGCERRRADFAGGAEQLAEAVRKARPDYDPSQDPNLLRPFLAPKVPTWVWVAGGAAVLLVIFRQPRKAG